MTNYNTKPKIKAKLDNLIDRSSLAKKLNVSPQTITNWVKQGKIPYIRIGRRIYFDIELIMESLSKRWLS